MKSYSEPIVVDDLSIEVVRKKIKNLHLRISPPHGTVKISAPLRMGSETIRLFALSKLDWIRKHQTRIRSRQWPAPLRYTTGESHDYLGKRYLLHVIEHRGRPGVVLDNDTLELRVRENSNRKKRQEIFDKWYRQQLWELLPNFFPKYEKIMNVRVEEWGVKKMKTKWGTCNIRARRIWLNLELAKKPLHCIESVVVHEMVHLLERKHNARFKRLMDGFLPGWRQSKEELNRLPIDRSDWEG